jgi:hypothetical protein
MNEALLGANDEPSPTDQAVVPAMGAPLSSTQRNAAAAPLLDVDAEMRFVPGPKVSGFLALRKIPPMPVTRFIKAPCYSAFTT